MSRTVLKRDDRASYLISSKESRKRNEASQGKKKKTKVKKGGKKGGR